MTAQSGDWAVKELIVPPHAGELSAKKNISEEYRIVFIPDEFTRLAIPWGVIYNVAWYESI